MKKTPPYFYHNRIYAIALLFFTFFSFSIQAQNNHEGTYVSNKDTIILNEMKNNYLSYFNTHSGRIGSLLKNKEGLYFLGTMNEKPDTSKKNYSATLQFARDNQKILVTDSTGKSTNFKKVAYVVKYISIQTSDCVILNAKLVIPKANHKVPLVIVAHGSEQVSNDFYFYGQNQYENYSDTLIFTTLPNAGNC